MVSINPTTTSADSLYINKLPQTKKEISIWFENANCDEESHKTIDAGCNKGGGIRTCKIRINGKLLPQKEFQYDADGNTISITSHKYDIKGNETSHIIQSVDGTISSWTENEYDEFDNLIKETSKDSQGIITSTVEYIYENGEPVDQIIRDADGSIIEA